MRTILLKRRLVKFLSERKEASTHEILDYVNETTTHGTTTHALGNVLSKHPELFRRVGSTETPRGDEVRYNSTLWGLALHAILKTKG